jgi:helix-turn-helix protein
MVDLPHLPKLFNEHAAAEALGVSIDTLRRERKRAKIAHTMIGGRIRYTEMHLTGYIEEHECPTKSSGSGKSADTGSASGLTPGSGAAPGSMPQLDRRIAHHLAQSILKTPS